MNTQELLNYLSEKKRITAPVAIAQDNLNKANQRLEKAKGKWKIGIIIVIALLALFVFGLFTGDTALFYFNENGTFQAGGIGGTLLFGALLALLLYIKQTRYVKPAERESEAAAAALQKARNNPEYQNGARDFPAKFYNYYDIYRLWNFVNEGRAITLREAYNLLETHQFQADQMAIQEDIRRLQRQIAATSKVNAAASVVTAYNTSRMRK